MKFEHRLRIFRFIVKPSEWWMAFWGWACGVTVKVTDEQENYLGDVLEREQRKL